jgi:hypothetical protein
MPPDGLRLSATEGSSFRGIRADHVLVSIGWPGAVDPKGLASLRSGHPSKRALAESGVNQMPVGRLRKRICIRGHHPADDFAPEGQA